MSHMRPLAAGEHSPNDLMTTQSARDREFIDRQHRKFIDQQASSASTQATNIAYPLFQLARSHLARGPLCFSGSLTQRTHKPRLLCRATRRHQQRTQMADHSTRTGTQRQHRPPCSDHGERSQNCLTAGGSTGHRPVRRIKPVWHQATCIEHSQRRT